jgi:ribosomal protein S18 acetylase RimI-like enzyme
VSPRAVDVVPVTDELVPELTGLWRAARVDSGTSPEVAERTVHERKLTEALRRPDVRAFLARVECEPVGFVVTSENPFGLTSTPEVAIEQLYVDRGVRRLGVARTLLAAVVGHAERTGCDVIVGNVPASSRDANRFFARLGFSSVLIRRVASTSALRRRITPAAQAAGATAGAELVLRRRRSLRHRGLGPATTRHPRSA